MFFVNTHRGKRWTIILAALKSAWLKGKTTLLIGGKYSELWKR